MACGCKQSHCSLQVNHLCIGIQFPRRDYASQEEEQLRHELSAKDYYSHLLVRGEAAGRKYHGVAPRLNGKWQARKTHYKV
jgi:hypothetical protein